MALARIEVLKGRSPEQKSELLNAVHEALISALKVPYGDPTLRVIEHSPESFLRPTAPRAVGERYTLIEITMFSGRSHATKRTLYREIIDRLEALGVPPADVTIVIIESPRENWGVQGGLPASEIDLGFDVEI